MNSLKIRIHFILILTALIWGVAFVAQSVGGDSLGPYTFNCIRSFIGALVLIPVIFIFSKNSQSPFTSKNKQRKFLILRWLMLWCMPFLRKYTSTAWLIYGGFCRKSRIFNSLLYSVECQLSVLFFQK